MNKIRILTILSIFMFIISIISSVSTKQVEALDWDPVKWVLCSDEEGKIALKADRTDWIPFLKYSKSAIGEEDTPRFNLYNSMLKATGYKIEDLSSDSKEINPFNKFGMRGLKFTSYRGEFKYYLVDPCRSDDRQFASSSNFGQFYLDRKEPFSTYTEIDSSKDNRVRVFSEGFFSAYGKAITDTIANGVLAVAKFIITLVLSLVSLAFSDLSALIGINSLVQENTVRTLYQNFFMPMVSIMFLFTAIYLIYYGLIKREFRQAVIGGVVKVIICFVLAVFVGINPHFTTIPNKIATTGQALILSAASGSMKPTEERGLCHTSVGFDKMDDMTDDTYLEKATDGITSVIGCKMWSAFIFKPLVEAQFGKRYNDLEDLGNDNSEWVGQPTVYLGNRDLNNWGLFYVSVLSGKHTPLNKISSPLVSTVNKDYYRIIDALSNYEEEETEVEINEEAGVNGNNNKFFDVVEKAPLESWNYFIGNRNGNKIGFAFIIVMFSIIGSIAPLLFALASAILGIGITILTMLSPIFLLLGCWGGKGNTIFMNYVGTLISTIIKKVITAFLMIVSIEFVTSAMNLINDVGFLESLLFLIVTTIIMIKNKDKFLDKMSQVNLGKLNLEAWNGAINKAKSFGKIGGEIIVSTTAGGITGKIAGGTVFQGMKDGSGRVLKNKMYMSRIGRTTLKSYESVKKEKLDDDMLCISCGAELKEGHMYVNEDELYYCADCASMESYEGMTELYLDDYKDNTIDLSQPEHDFVNLDEVDQTVLKDNTYLTYSEMLKLNYSDLDDSQDKGTNYNEIKYRAEQTQSLLNRTLDAVNPANRIKRVFVPDPIKDLVNTKVLHKAVKNNKPEIYKKELDRAWKVFHDNLDFRAGISKNNGKEINIDDIEE